VGYLTGDADTGNFNHQSGQIVPVLLPATPRFVTYTLQGPGLSSTEAIVPRTENQSELSLPQAVTPGNYTLIGGDGKRTANFSVNPPPEESQLSRVPPEQIEAVLGNGALLPVGHGVKLHDALQGHWSQPMELFPWLMILVLLALAVENLLANKFYRRDSAGDETGSNPPAHQEA
jgi:hypothetical protein